MAKKIANTTPGKKIRHMVFYSQGDAASWRITQQIDHSWFLTVFGQENIGKPYDINEFMEFVHDKYDEGAVFELGDYGVVMSCAPLLKFTELDIANKFLADFTQILEKLA